MSHRTLELVWIDRREIVILGADDGPTLLDGTLDRLVAAHRTGEIIPIFGRPGRVLAFDPVGLSFTVEDASTAHDFDERNAP